MAMFTGPTSWDTEPPYDPVAAKKSKEIDDWLRLERAKELRTSFKTLILSPDGPSFDTFRERLSRLCGDQLDLGENCKTEVSSFQLTRKESRKTMGGREPSILIYAIDPGENLSEEDALPTFKKALSHLLFTTRVLAVSNRCVVIVLVARGKLISKYAHQDNPEWDEWCNLFPTLRSGYSASFAVQTELSEAAKAEASPLHINFAFHDDGFDDASALSLLKKVMHHSHEILLKSLEDSVPEAVNNDDHTELPPPPPASSSASIEPLDETTKVFQSKKVFIKDLNPNYQPSKDVEHPKNDEKKVQMLWWDNIIFAFEVCLFIFAVLYPLPWPWIREVVTYYFKQFYAFLRLDEYY